MVGKSVARAVCLLPVLTGCAAVHNLTTEGGLAHTQRAIARDLRHDARAAWRCVREQYPRRAFTEEFRDGFLDGYADYLDRGGAAQPPAAPPFKYVKNKKYFTPEGHCLVNDYYLGFKYGSEVAVASGKRQYLTIPVLVADGSCPPGGAPVPGVPAVPFIPVAPPSPPDPLPPPRPLPRDPKKKGSDDPPDLAPRVAPAPEADAPATRSPQTGAALPTIKPFNPPWPGDKFSPLPVPPNPDLLPPPDPPLPEVPSPPLPVPPTRPDAVPSILPSSMRVAVPAPPDAVPTLPPGAPTPSILDDIPVVPFRPVSLPPVPFRPLHLGK